MIACKTIIGFGAPTKAGTAATHGSPLGKDEIAGAREKLGWSHGPFDVPEPIFSAWRKVGARAAVGLPQVGEAPCRDGRALTAPSSTAASRATSRRPFGEAIGLRLQGQGRSRKALVGDAQVEQKVLEVINPVLPDTVGGSADLTGSNNTKTGLAEGQHAPTPPAATSTTASASTRWPRP